MTHEAAIRDLESEKSRLKDKVLRLEEERASLLNKSQALDERQRQQILTLEKVPSKHHITLHHRAGARRRSHELSVAPGVYKIKTKYSDF